MSRTWPFLPSYLWPCCNPQYLNWNLVIIPQLFLLGLAVCLSSSLFSALSQSWEPFNIPPNCCHSPSDFQCLPIIPPGHAQSFCRGLGETRLASCQPSHCTSSWDGLYRLSCSHMAYIPFVEQGHASAHSKNSSLGMTSPVRAFSSPYPVFYFLQCHPPPGRPSLRPF